MCAYTEYEQYINKQGLRDKSHGSSKILKHVKFKLHLMEEEEDGYGQHTYNYYLCLAALQCITCF